VCCCVTVTVYMWCVAVLLLQYTCSVLLYYWYSIHVVCCCVTVTVYMWCVAVLLLQYTWGVLLCYCYSIHEVCCCVTVTVFMWFVAVLLLQYSCGVLLCYSYSMRRNFIKNLDAKLIIGCFFICCQIWWSVMKVTVLCAVGVMNRRVEFLLIFNINHR
jgi:hypothetical protein